MRRDDIIRLMHMLDAAREAILFAQGRKRADLDSDRMLVLSLVKAWVAKRDVVSSLIYFLFLPYSHTISPSTYSPRGDSFGGVS